MLIDDVTIKVRAGNGGRGKAAFNSNMNSLGPTGGSGGNGGNVFMEGATNIYLLGQLRFKKELNAGDGQNGKSQYNDGNDGDDISIKIPIGTVIHNLDTGSSDEIIEKNQKVLVASGGRGGKGNFHFRGPHNTSPKEFQEGKPGEKYTLRLELKLIADVGFIGLPNVGKSSVLNELTNAKSKVANYRFTTLEPNLGAYYELILADIPGLIEGASTGKGLGIKFLKHIERTKVLFHFISSESEDPSGDYKTIRKELGEYNKKLLEKPEYVFISKSDLTSNEIIKKNISKLNKLKLKPISVSIHDSKSLDKIKVILNNLKD
jgi:GTPase